MLGDAGAVQEKQQGLFEVPETLSVKYSTKIYNCRLCQKEKTVKWDPSVKNFVCHACGRISIPRSRKCQ